jgi:hypothetical protein
MQFCIALYQEVAASPLSIPQLCPSPYEISSNTISPKGCEFHGRSFLPSHLFENDKFCNHTDVYWKDTMLRYAHTGNKQIHLAIVALQCALRMLRHLEILFETLSNCALCTSWAFGLLPKNLS